jgi:hypothetical protein
MPGHEPTIYGNVDKAFVSDILDQHIGKGKILDDHVLIKTYQSAL